MLLKTWTLSECHTFNQILDLLVLLRFRPLRIWFRSRLYGLAETLISYDIDTVTVLARRSTIVCLSNFNINIINSFCYVKLTLSESWLYWYIRLHLKLMQFVLKIDAALIIMQSTVVPSRERCRYSSTLPSLAKWTSGAWVRIWISSSYFALLLQFCLGSLFGWLIDARLLFASVLFASFGRVLLRLKLFYALQEPCALFSLYWEKVTWFCCLFWAPSRVDGAC